MTKHKPRKKAVSHFILSGFSAACFALILCIALLALPGQSAAKGNPKYASLVMDADTGMILHQRYANKSLHPASLTKIMTLLLTFDALESGRISLRDRVRISKKAASMVPSKLGLPVGSSIRVQDAIYVLVTKSANDIAVALAEHIGGSEHNFAKLMTDRARGIGMTRTRFRNASGLHDARQVTTARDMAKMARYVINVYPEYYRYFSRKSFTYKGKTYRNHNRLMNTYSGMDGMKTGYIAASGFNLIASATRNNRRIIGVVFGGRSSKTRNAHMANLLDMGFKKVKNIRIAKAPVPVPPRKPAIAQVYAALDAQQRSAATNSALPGGFEELIGEGDFDPINSSRIKTGLMAIAAHTGKAVNTAVAKPRVTPVAYSAPQKKNARNSWSIQVGAFGDRKATNKALQEARQILPSPYSFGQPAIAPLQTPSGWLYRARLSGYTKQDALKACGYIRDCLLVAPHN